MLTCTKSYLNIDFSVDLYMDMDMEMWIDLYLQIQYNLTSRNIILISIKQDIDMIPVVCLGTFAVFTTYWIVASLSKKTYTAIKRRNTKITPSSEQIRSQSEHKYVTTSGQQLRQQQKQPLISAGAISNLEQKEDVYKLGLSKSSKGVDYLDANVNLNNNENDLASNSNLLNVAMIDDKEDCSKLGKEVINEKQGCRQTYTYTQRQRQRQMEKKKDYDDILEDIITQSQQKQQQQNQQAIPTIQIITVKSEEQQQQVNQDAHCPDINTHVHTKYCQLQLKSPLISDIDINNRLSKTPTEQKSELEIIQALTQQSQSKNNRIGAAKIDEHDLEMEHQHEHQHQQQHGDILMPEISSITSAIGNDGTGLGIGDRKSSQGDPVISKLIQQIDQLFLNDPASFASIINKYKVQQTRYNGYQQHQHQHQHEYDPQNEGHQHGQGQSNNNNNDKWQQLQQKNKKLINDLQIMQIAVSEYKTVADSKDKQIQQNQSKITKLQDRVKQLQAENNQLAINLNQIKSIKPSNQSSSPSSPSNTNNKSKSIQVLQAQNQNLKQQLLQYKTQLSKSVTALQQGRVKIAELEDQLKANQSKNSNNNNDSEDVKLKAKQLQEHVRELEDGLRGKQAELSSTVNKYEEIIKQLTSKNNTNNNPNSNNDDKKQNDGPMSTRQNLNLKSQSNPLINGQANPKTQVEQQLIDLKKANQNLKNQIQFAQTQIRMFEQSESSHLNQIQALQQQLDLTKNSEVSQLKSKVYRMQPIVNEYQTMQRRYFEMKLKYEKLLHERSDVKSKLNSSNSSVKRDGINLNINDQGPGQRYSSQIVMPTSPKVNRGANFNVSSPSPVTFYSPGGNNFNNVNQRQGSQIGSSQSPGHYKFLFDCGFVNNQDRQFVYDTLHKLLKGVLKTQKLYNSKSNRAKNPHDLIDNIRSILLVIHLQNNKILAAYTHQPFSALNPHSSTQNIAFILDVSNRKSFTNQSGINSISYNSGSLVWGFNQILLKNDENQVMYTNFCRNHNIYWDGKYKIDQFIGADKQWARIWQYQIFRVSKL